MLKTLFSPRLTITVTKDGVRTKARGSLAEVNTFVAKLHDHLTDRAEFSDKTNGRILNGQWNKKLDEAEAQPDVQ